MGKPVGLGLDTMVTSAVPSQPAEKGGDFLSALPPVESSQFVKDYMSYLASGRQRDYKTPFPAHFTKSSPSDDDLRNLIRLIEASKLSQDPSLGLDALADVDEARKILKYRERESRSFADEFGERRIPSE